MKIQLITCPRMGSTYFYNMLRLFYTPYQIFIKWNEVFNLNERKSNHNVDEIINDAVMHTDIVCKNHINYFDNISQQQLDKWNKIKWYNIVLIRRNFLDTSLSLAKSTVTDEWTTYTNQCVTIPLETFQYSMDMIFHNTKNIIHNKYSVPYHAVVYYEDLYFDHTKDFAQLDLSNNYDYKKYKDWYPEVDVNARMRGVNPAPNKLTTIENYQELRDYAQDNYHKYKSKRFRIVDGFLKRVNIDTQYIDISKF